MRLLTSIQQNIPINTLILNSKQEKGCDSSLTITLSFSTPLVIYVFALIYMCFNVCIGCF